MLRLLLLFALSTALKLPFFRPVTPGKLILVRHGESLWNANKTFTGWCDPDLSPRGHREATHASRLLLEKGYEIDVVYTSRLKRSIRSAWEILEECDKIHLPVYKSWRLNERHYGAFQGESKIGMAVKLGPEAVQKFRGGLHERPPPLTVDSPFYPGKERRHADLSLSQLPLTESLYDCMKRSYPLYETRIKDDLRSGRNVMVVAHGNSVRGLIKMIDGIGDKDIQDVAVPTGIPIIYKFDLNLNPIHDADETNSDLNMTGAFEGIVAKNVRGLFLEKPGLLREALQREQEWKDNVPGYNPSESDTIRSTFSTVSNLERSLIKLEEERNFNNPSLSLPSPSPSTSSPTTSPTNDLISATSVPNSTASLVNGYGGRRVNPCVAKLPNTIDIPTLKTPVRKDAVIVIIRHGKTSNNKLGLFTGWEDAPLADEGRDEARAAGKLLKQHGFEFDVVYTSWLSRAIETAWLVLDELDSLWLPIIKSWRLNERMYGELTGLSKKMVSQKHGQAQFMKWRRGFRDRPPPVTSFSSKYPGNDERYVRNLKDRRYSVRESFMRSLDSGRFQLHRKLPKTESLSDCMERTLPYLTDKIIPESVNQGKRVLISSSENAIRGLLMHLCEIPEDRISELEIPNGLPLIYDVNSRCIKLLDDGTGRDLMEAYNFGPATDLLFRPCITDDGDIDEECDLTYMWPTIEFPSTAESTLTESSGPVLVPKTALAYLDSL